MEKGFKIYLDEENSVQLEPVNLSIDELIALSGTAVEISLDVALEKYKTDEDTKELRAALYDRLIIMCTHIAQKIYPEYVDLYEKTPEALLEELDRLAKIESNKQESN